MAVMDMHLVVIARSTMMDILVTEKVTTEQDIADMERGITDTGDQVMDHRTI